MTQEIHLGSNHTMEEKLRYAVQALMEQACRSIRPVSYTDFCMYRSPEGNKCLIGHLIRDEDYVPEMEDLTAEQIIMSYYTKDYNQEERAFLNTVQRGLHDQIPDKDFADLSLESERVHWYLKKAKALDAAKTHET